MSIRQLQRDLDRWFGGTPVAQPARHRVLIGANGTPPHEADELGQYPSLKEARAAADAYNERVGPAARVYAWAPERIR